MAMPPGNVSISDKIQFPAVNGGASNEIHQKHHQFQQWFPVDERDGFISWLRGEFAAANAIIDTLCNHLRAIGDPGEYDLAIGSIQQRRSHWNPVLHMQQYFSIGEVIFSLQQVALRKQQKHRYSYDQPKNGGKEYRRFSNVGFNKRGFGAEVAKPVADSGLENNSADGNSSKNVGVENSNENVKEVVADDSSKRNDDSLKSSEISDGNATENLVSAAETVGPQSSPKENDTDSSENQNVKQNQTLTPKTFVASEIVDGKMVNVVEGLNLYEQVLDNVEVSKIISLVNDLRAAGRRGQLQGQTYVVSKRPMRGRGREMIQLGHPIVDPPIEDENSAAISKERRSEPIPTLLEDVIERFVGMQIMTVKPDACVIDIYNEGDHSQPHIWPAWFGKPISVLFLTECDLSFGRLIMADHPGDYKGSLKLSLAPGSLLVMQGRSTEIPKHAIPAIRKQRILVTFTKFQPRKFDGQRLAPPGSSSHWGPPPVRSVNHIRHSGPPKHYSAIPTTGVLPALPNRPPIPAPNGVQPLFVAAPMPFPAPVVPLPPVSTGWAAGPPRHPPPSRLPAPPGTGVFLPPPGSGNALDKENGPGKNLDDTSESRDCNGIGKGGAVEEGQHEDVDHTTVNDSAEAV